MLSLFAAHPLIFLIIFPGILMTIAIHEFAHCWAADKLGDPTPRIKGRLTLDPRVHLDPLGVIAILLTRFGWGKPAPFDPFNLKEPVRDTALIAAAGGISNFIVAALLAMILRFVPMPVGVVSISLVQLAAINIYLAIFNLIPVGPLDGVKVLKALLPRDLGLEYERFMERYGIMILILLLIPFGGGQMPIVQLVSPIANFFLTLLLG
jgi:Zn-dependent protease